jgi:hypothetical protein
VTSHGAATFLSSWTPRCPNTPLRHAIDLYHDVGAETCLIRPAPSLVPEIARARARCRDGRSADGRDNSHRSTRSRARARVRKENRRDGAQARTCTPTSQCTDLKRESRMRWGTDDLDGVGTCCAACIRCRCRSSRRRRRRRRRGVLGGGGGGDGGGDEGGGGGGGGAGARRVVVVVVVDRGDQIASRTRARRGSSLRLAPSVDADGVLSRAWFKYLQGIAETVAEFIEAGHCQVRDFFLLLSFSNPGSTSKSKPARDGWMDGWMDGPGIDVDDGNIIRNASQCRWSIE